MEFLAGYKAFLDYRYWLNPNPVPLGPSLVGGVFTFFAWFIIAWAGLRLAARWLQKTEPLKAGIARKFASVMGTTGALGLLLLFFAYEQIALLGMRFWLLPLSFYFLFRLMRIAIYVVRDYPIERGKIEERRRFEKYMPARK